MTPNRDVLKLVDRMIDWNEKFRPNHRPRHLHVGVSAKQLVNALPEGSTFHETGVDGERVHYRGFVLIPQQSRKPK